MLLLTYNAIKKKRILSLEHRLHIGLGNKGKCRGPLSEEHKNKIANSSKNKPKTLEHSQKIALALKNKKKSPEHIKHIIEALTGTYLSEQAKENIKKNANHVPKTLEHRKKISDAHKGKPKVWLVGTHRSIETRKKQSISALQSYKNGRRLNPDAYNKSKPEILVKQMIDNGGFIEGIDYYHSKYIKEIEHSYFADFMFPMHRVVIEGDGEYVHKNRKEIDAFRTKELENIGYTVLRVSDKLVYKNPELVKSLIQLIFINRWI